MKGREPADNQPEFKRCSTLAGFEAPLGLVDDVEAAFAAHQAVVAVATTQ
jgi:hypothetical protein